MAAASPAPPGGKQHRNGDLHQRVSYLPDLHRLLPQAPDAERGVLSSFLLAPREVGALCAEKGVKAEHFHLPAHATIYALLLELWGKDQPGDFITVTQALRDRGQLDQVGGAPLITELFTFLPTAANAGYYVEILEEKFTLREIIKVCTEYAARSYDEQDDVPTLLAEAESKIMAIGQQRTAAPAISISQHIVNAIARLETLHESKALTGLSTGFPVIDDTLDGLHRQELIVIAARPSVGKTALAMNIAEHIALDLKLPVAVFSLEMTAGQLIDRMLCGKAMVNARELRHRPFNDREAPALTRAAQAISDGETRLLIEDDPHLQLIENLMARARQLKQKNPDLAAIFIDYFTLLRWGAKQKNDNRTNELGHISRSLKGLAKSLNLPVILLAQINRRYVDRIGRPELSDLKDCGDLEQDADVVGFLNRDEMHAANDEERKACEGKAELMIRKQRNGPLGDIALTFLKEFTRFETRAFDAEDQPQLPITDDPRANRRRKSER